MNIRNSILIMLGIGITMLSSACSDEIGPSDREDTTSQSDVPTSFDPCEDLSMGFISEHGFHFPPMPFGPVAVIGPNQGKGCVYVAEGSYDVTIAVADAEIGDAAGYNKLVYEEYAIDGRPAEIARAQNRSDIGGSYVGSGSCVLNVEIPDGLLAFHSENYPLSEDAPEPCEKLTEIAREVVAMLPPAK